MKITELKKDSKFKIIGEYNTESIFTFITLSGPLWVTCWWEEKRCIAHISVDAEVEEVD